jgi:hypothetical protein
MKDTMTIAILGFIAALALLLIIEKYGIGA